MTAMWVSPKNKNELKEVDGCWTDGENFFEEKSNANKNEFFHLILVNFRSV